MSARSDEAGLSRRTVLTRSATGAGIMLSGSFSGLFGSGTAASAAGRGKPGGVGYGALVSDPKGRPRWHR